MAGPKTRDSDFQRGVRAALEVCRKLRDSKGDPKSWEKLYSKGYHAGAADCCAMIINELHPKLR